MRNGKFYGALVAGFVFFGCAHVENRAQLAQFSTAYYATQHAQADKMSKDFISKDKKNRDTPLWNLENGVNAFMMGNYQASVNTLDLANKTFDTNYQNMEKGIAKAGAATYGSAANIPYEGHMYEWTLTNYYMALDYMFLNKKQDARVEFNRTIERQRRIKDAYRKEIAKAQEQAKKAKSKNGNKFAKLLAGTNQMDAELKQTYSNLEKFKAYDGFINPMVSYVSGLFFCSNKDAKGLDDLKEAYGVSKNPVVAQDIKNFVYGSKEKFTWVIVEDGKQPTLKEYKIDAINLALPLLVPGQDFHKSFQLVVENKAENLSVLSNFGAIVGKEYQTTLPAIKARAITSAILKTGTEKGLEAAGQYAGGYGGLAASIGGTVMHAANKASTAADTRSSNIFPNIVYIGRIKNSEANNFALNVDNSPSLHATFHMIACDAEHGASLAHGAKDHQVCINTNNIIFVRSLPSSLNVKVLSLY
ncbi:hypothetical protein [Helicobacter suis]|uniref:hypothetical protein n=1 Tax=Helicobacter suis TaxID=104628 RepID=UPI0013D555D3|nr:hypothetical protein [Helicobacter suis]